MFKFIEIFIEEREDCGQPEIQSGSIYGIYNVRKKLYTQLKKKLH